jgi:uncharacterized membrane protein YjjP (DUF1212 family)
MVKPWVTYSLVRIGIFALALTVLMLVGLEWWLAALLAAVIGFLVSYIFFAKLRDAVTADIVARREAPEQKNDDALAEDVD